MGKTEIKVTHGANESEGLGTIEITVEVKAQARDQLKLKVVHSSGEIVSSELSGIGCTEVLSLLEEFRSKLTGRLESLPLPVGSGHGSMLLRELILKVQGRWDFPYKEEELCHCRAVATAKVDSAIIAGCHSVDAVKRATSASTSCGTCRPNIEELISYRLHSNS